MPGNSYARAGSYASLGILLGLFLYHASFWLFGSLADGGHVARDFDEAGVTLATVDRLLGFVIGGLPVAFFMLSLEYLRRLFVGLKTTTTINVKLASILVRASVHALLGAVLLLLYPSLLSLGFFLTQPPGSRVFLVSAQPHVQVLLFATGLLFLAAKALKASLQPEARDGSGPSR